MKGTQGLMIAAGLAVAGAVCNWFYVSRKAADLEKVDFIYVKETARLRAGERFKEADLGKVRIPRRYVGELDKVAVKWEQRASVVGRIANRAFPRDELLLREDLATPPQKTLSQQLGPNEVAQPVLVNPTTFVAANYNPGEYVSFGPPTTVRGTKNAKQSVGEVGPFKILRIGSRGGSAEVQAARGVRESRSNIITIPLTKTDDGKYDEKSQRLLELLEYAGGQGLEVKTLSARKKPQAQGT